MLEYFQKRIIELFHEHREAVVTSTSMIVSEPLLNSFIEQAKAETLQRFGNDVEFRIGVLENKMNQVLPDLS